jgi:hypothetical protein
MAVAPGHAIAALDPVLLAHGPLSPLALVPRFNRSNLYWQVAVYERATHG